MLKKYYLPILIYLFAVGACKVAEVPGPAEQQAQPETEIQPEPLIPGELRGALITSPFWVDDEQQAEKENLFSLLDNLEENHFNTVFFQVYDGYGPLYLHTGRKFSPVRRFMREYDPVKEAVLQAHRNGLQFHALWDMNTILEQVENSVDYPGLNFAGFKSYIKELILPFLEHYNIDGMHFRVNDFSLLQEVLWENGPEEPGLNVRQIDEKFLVKFTDLLEDIQVEIMLLKPYLITSVSLDLPLELENNNYLIPGQTISSWLGTGIADLFIPVFTPDAYTYDSIRSGLMDEKSTPLNRRIIPGLKVNLQEIDSVDFAGLMDRIDIQTQTRSVLVIPSEPLNEPFRRKYPVSFPEKMELPDSLKQLTTRQAVGLDFSEITGQHDPETRPVILHLHDEDQSEWPDQEGRIGFTIHELPDTLKLTYGDNLIELPTRFWQIPFSYTISPDLRAERVMPWLELRSMPHPVTPEAEHHMLYKTKHPAKAWIGMDTVKVYKTGVFFNRVAFKEGKNRIRAGVLCRDSATAFYETEYVYRKTDQLRDPLPLWIEERSVMPRETMILTPEDVVLFRFHGSLGQEGAIKVFPGDINLPCSRNDYEDYSIYEAELSLDELDAGTEYSFGALIRSAPENEDDSLTYPIPGRVEVRESKDFPYVKTIDDHVRMTYTLGDVRLGGPLRAEYPPGVVLKTTGRIGDQYRVELNSIDNGYISAENVTRMPENHVREPFYITSLACGPLDSMDIVSIPYLKPVPYAVYPEPDLNRIRITLYGAKTSSTWITHRKGRKIIDKVTWQQVTPVTYEIYVNLKSPEIWGYELIRDENRLILSVKHPPEISGEAASPLSGLKIAIEAGHGGVSTGAVGLSGLLEKDINLDLAFRLGDVLESYGAKVLQVRPNDTTMSLVDKREIAVTSSADLLISIHANAAGTRRGYLGVSGTSTYYHNPFWAPFAEMVYDRLLEMDLAEFGVVGSFNYTVTRVSQMPSILVEQAFMTHALDEEKLASEEFRQQMAEKILKGLLDYLDYMKN